MAISWVRRKKNLRVVADFGCGDAQLAQELSATHTTVHSFDLIARSPCVTACNMADVPLESGVAVCTLYAMHVGVGICSLLVACSLE